MDQREIGAFVTIQIVTVASTNLLWLSLLVLFHPASAAGQWSESSMTGVCRCRGPGKGQFCRHVSFGMRRPSSTQCRGASRKEPQQYVALFRTCPSPGKRPRELAYHNRACACSSVILSICRTTMAGWAVPAPRFVSHPLQKKNNNLFSGAHKKRSGHHVGLGDRDK